MTSETTPPAATSTAQVTSPVVLDNAAQPTVENPIVPKTEVAPDPAAAGAPVVDPAKPTDPAQTTQQDWAIKRINEITAKRYEAERGMESEKKLRLAAEDKARELLAQMGKAPSAEPVKPGLTEEEVERRAQEKATVIAQARVFNEACDAVAATGKKEFGDAWQTDLNNLALVGALGKDVPTTFLETVIELKNSHKVLHHLAGNMEEAARIAKLPPQRMALEMARIEAQINTPPAPPPAPAISNAPMPVIPIGGQAKVTPGNLDDPNLAADDWYALRAKQLEEKRNRYRRT